MLKILTNKPRRVCNNIIHERTEQNNTLNIARAKLRKATVIFVMSVCPHGTTRTPMDGFLNGI